MHVNLPTTHGVGRKHQEHPERQAVYGVPFQQFGVTDGILDAVVGHEREPQGEQRPTQVGDDR
jgi:hypothetical protein